MFAKKHIAVFPRASGYKGIHTPIASHVLQNHISSHCKCEEMHLKKHNSLEI